MGIQRGDQGTPTASSSTNNPLIQKFGQLHVLDDLIRLRATDVVQHPILAYPRTDQDTASFTYYTGQELDEMIDQVVAVLMNDGFQPVGSSFKGTVCKMLMLVSPSPRKMDRLWLSSHCPI